MANGQKETILAVALASAAIGAVLALHLTLALLAAMLVYVVGRRLTEWLQSRTRLDHAGAWSIAILVALVAGAGTAIVETMGDVAGGTAGFQALLEQMATALGQLRTILPAWIAAHVPVSLDALQAGTVSWLRGHAMQVSLWSQHAFRAATYLLAGALIGALALVESRPANARRAAPATAWLAALMQRFALFEASFGTVVFAQLRIAAVNTLLTGIYVLVVLPALGAPLPMAFTLVAFTFVASLIPVAGNLISNSAIVIVSLTHGLGITGLSVGFLVVVHKLEYLLNARIVGARTGARAFELLAVMLVFEAMFGLGGLVMAPIAYAYAKAELRAAGWL
jgi:predicted PurR-regulated permease PerM